MENTLVYVPEQVKEVARKAGIYSIFNNFVDQLKLYGFQDALKLWENRNQALYKKLMRNYRVIASAYQVDGFNVIVILALLPRGSKEWQTFNADPNKYLQNKQKALNILQGLKKFIADIKVVPEGELKPPLPDRYNHWFLTFHSDLSWWAQHDYKIIFESKNWVQTMQKKKFRENLVYYYQMLRSLLTDEGQHRHERKIDCMEVISHSSDSRYKIYYIDGKFLGPNMAKGNFSNFIYLVDAIDTRYGEQDSCVSVRREFCELLKEQPIDWDKIARRSARAYPGYVLLESDLWRDIQNDEEANLALSLEEINILNRVLFNDSHNKPVLPIFINGRAGSGKSTLLYYIFAHYLKRKYDIISEQRGSKASVDTEDDILFLTYSSGLLETARRVVESILKNSLLTGLDSTQVKELTELSKNSFWAFKDFLLRLLPEDERINFPSEKYITYGVFTRMYENRGFNQIERSKSFRSNRPVTSDLAWHIIRTYIKGYKWHGYLTPEEYKEISEREKSVSQDDYVKVYNNVWKRWYKNLREDGFWDILDLARTVLNNPQWLESKYAVVFCDEAQDFTRVELDLIMGLLVYRNYLLKGHNLRLPLALAGDPFQTLNPTGFRWEFIKALFHDSLSRHLSQKNKGTLGFYYEDLKYNYRSQIGIVKVSNLVQLWRKLLFGADVEPQEPWHLNDTLGDEAIPYVFILTDDSKSKILSVLREKQPVVIIPSDEGEEEEFRKRDDILKEIEESDNIEFHSPISAKGMEFNQVVLYKFGDKWDEEFFVFDSSADGRNGKLLRREYLLNKLYVALTRAKSRLVIIDTEKGYKNLWRYMENLSELEEVLKQYDDNGEFEKWKKYIGLVARSEEIEAMLEHQEPIELAYIYRQVGEANEDAYLLEKASKYYSLAGKDYEEEEIWCKALAQYYRGDYKKASENFIQIRKYKEAEKSLWKSQDWSRLLEFYDKYSQKFAFNKLWKIITEYHSSSEKNPIDFLKNVVDVMAKKQYNWNDTVETIKNCILEINSLIKSKSLNLHSNEKGNLLLALENLPDGVILKIGPKEVGMLFYSLGVYKDALRIWDYLDSTNFREYFYARADQSRDIEEKLKWLRKAEDWQAILQEFGYTERKLTDTEAWDAVRWAIDTYIKEDQRELGIIVKFLNILRDSGETRQLIEYLVKLVKYTADSDRERVMKIVWNCIDKFLEDSKFDDLDRLGKKLSGYLREEEKALWLEKVIKAKVDKGDWFDVVCMIDPGWVKENFPKRRCKSTSKPTFSGIIRNREGRFDKLLLRGLGNTVQEAIGEEDLKLLTRYLKEVIVNRIGYNVFSDVRRFQEFSAAYERVGRRIDVLKWYEEAFERENLDPQIADIAKKRWARVKLARINFLKDDESKYKTVKGEYDDLRAKLKKWKIRENLIKKLPEYLEPPEYPESGEVSGLEVEYDIDEVEKQINELSADVFVLNRMITPNDVKIIKLGLNHPSGRVRKLAKKLYDRARMFNLED